MGNAILIASFKLKTTPSDKSANTIYKPSEKVSTVNHRLKSFLGLLAFLLQKYPETRTKTLTATMLNDLLIVTIQ